MKRKGTLKNKVKNNITANFEALWDFVQTLSTQEKGFSASNSGEQKSLFEAIRKAQKEEKELTEETFNEIKNQVVSKSFSNLVNDLTKNLLKNLAQHLYSYDLDANLPENVQKELPENRKKHLAEQNIFKNIYLTEFLFENKSYELARKIFKKLKSNILQEEMFGFYGRVYDLEKRLAFSKIVESPKILTEKETEQTLKKFFEISQRIHALKSENEIFPETAREFEQIREKLKEKLQEKAFQEDIFASFGNWLDTNLKRIEQDTEHQSFKNTLHKHSAQFSFYHLLLLYLQVCEKSNFKIENFEEILHIKSESETFANYDIFDSLFRLNIRIRQYFEAYKTYNLAEMERLLQEIRQLKRNFTYNENLFFTALGYFLENLVFGLEHRFVLELQKNNPEIDAYELLEKRSQKIEENLKIFSQKAISNLIWRHHLNCILLNFRLCSYNHQTKENKECISQIDNLCELANFDKKYPQYFVEINVMKAVLLKLQKQEVEVKNLFRSLERKDTQKPEVLKNTETDFYKTIKKVLLDNKEPNLAEACKIHKSEIEALQLQTLLQQAILDFLKQSFPEKDKQRYQRFNRLLEPAIIAEERQSNGILNKISHFQNSILAYCLHLQNQDWERWKTLFPKVVHRYILLYDHSIEHIVENMKNFFKKRTNIYYRAKTAELLVKIHGDMAIVPIVLGWQHNQQEPYEACVETRFYFDGNGKIKVVEELKILYSSGNF